MAPDAPSEALFPEAPSRSSKPQPVAAAGPFFFALSCAGMTRLQRVTDTRHPVARTSDSRPLVDFIAGTAGGIAGIAVGHPFDTVKVRFQSPSFAGRYSSTVDAFRQIVRAEGAAGLYKGVISPLVGIAPVNGLVFASFKGTMAVLVPASATSRGVEAPLTTYFVAGCVSGAVASLINTPTELVKIRQQAFTGSAGGGRLPSPASPIPLSSLTQPQQQPPGTWSLARSIWATGGVRALFRGFTPCVLRDLGYGPYFLTYELLLRTISPSRPSSSGRPDLLVETEDELAGDPGRGWWAVAVAGAVAGVVSWTATFPFDVVKTRMQAASLATQPAVVPATAAGAAASASSRLASSSFLSAASAGGARSPLATGASRSFARSLIAPSPAASRTSPSSAVNPFQTTKSTVFHAWRTGGLRSFYIGLAPTLLRAIPTNIATFSLVRHFRILVPTCAID